MSSARDTHPDRHPGGSSDAAGGGGHYKVRGSERKGCVVSSPGRGRGKGNIGVLWDERHMRVVVRAGGGGCVGRDLCIGGLGCPDGRWGTPAKENWEEKCWRGH